MTSFADAVHMSGAGPLRWTVPDGWQQGRGAWGGLVVGAMVHAVACSEDPGRRVRTVSAHLHGPTLAGESTVTVEPRRIGSAMSTWSVRIADAAGEPTADGVVITGRPRAPELDDHYPAWGRVAAPDLPHWSQVPVTPVAPPLGPAFAEHLEFRIIAGLPFSSAEPRTAGWIRFPGQGAWSAEQLLGIIDGWWPCAYPVLEAPHPMATVSFSAHVLVDPATIPAGEPLAFEGVMSAAHEGFTSELRRLWCADGRLAVENHQSIVVIR